MSKKNRTIEIEATESVETVETVEPIADVSESKEAKFVRLATKRMNKVLKSLKNIGNLATSNYRYEATQIEFMRVAVQAQVDETFSKFGGKKPIEGFKF